MKQPHAVLHVKSACAQLSLSQLPRQCTRLPSPLSVSSNRILFSYHALLLKRLPQCSQSHCRIPIQLKNTKRRQPSNIHYNHCYIIIYQRPDCSVGYPQKKVKINHIVILNLLYQQKVDFLSNHLIPVKPLKYE